MWKMAAALAASFVLSANAQGATSRCDLAAAAADAAGAGCQRAWMDRNLKLNDLVTIGTHNSYKTEVPEAVLALIRKAAPDRADELDYRHRPLSEQLDAGVRQLEIDVYNDPTGGRFLDPAGLRAAGVVLPPAWRAALAEPGFKVMHVQDIDVLSACARLMVCLGVVRRWSLAHPGHARDVTERLAIEAEMVEAKAAVEAASKAKSEFLANMSHELRTPLNAILGFSEVIRDQVLGDAPSAWAKYKEYAGSIYASGTHLLSLISEVLDLSKIESGGYRLYLERFDMQAVIQDSLMLVRPQADRTKVSILPIDVRGDVTVDADMRAVKQVIINLLANAVKFTPSGGEIAVCCYEENDIVHVRVRDSGIGIAEELLESVFEAFHRGDSKLARQYDGTGLGLSVCRRLVEMHGGRIRLESAPNKGTTVFFHLPKRNSAATNTERAA